MKSRCRICHRRPTSLDQYCSTCIQNGRANPRPPPPKLAEPSLFEQFRNFRFQPRTEKEIMASAFDKQHSSRPNVNQILAYLGRWSYRSKHQFRRRNSTDTSGF